MIINPQKFSLSNAKCNFQKSHMSLDYRKRKHQYKAYCSREGTHPYNLSALWSFDSTGYLWSLEQTRIDRWDEVRPHRWQWLGPCWRLMANFLAEYFHLLLVTWVTPEYFCLQVKVYEGKVEGQQGVRQFPPNTQARRFIHQYLAQRRYLPQVEILNKKALTSKMLVGPTAVLGRC